MNLHDHVILYEEENPYGNGNPNDGQNPYGNGNNGWNPNNSQRKPPYGNPFLSAALSFGITALVTCCCIYLSLICSALGILFALLSKGGDRKMSQPARNACVISVAAMIATTLITAASVFITIRQYGSFENMMAAYEEIYSGYFGQAD